MSTGLFALLTLLVTGAHFRSGKGEQFTLSRIATALDKSDIPSQLAQIKRDAEPTRALGTVDAGHSEENLLKDYGDRIVTLDNGGDGTLQFRTPDVGQAL